MTTIRVAAKAFIVHNDCFLLLERRCADSHNPPEYDIPGGGIEDGESYATALEREIREETGLQATLQAPLRAWNYSEKPGEMLYGVTFVASHHTGTVHLSDEHQAWKWVRFKDIDVLNLPQWIIEEAKLADQWLKGRNNEKNSF